MRPTPRSSLFILLALVCSACNETKTPSEPAAVAATPTPTPTPTPAPGASLTGTITERSGAPFSGAAVVACQNVSTQTLATPPGRFVLNGLKAGSTVVKVYAQGQRTPQQFDVDLQPGANTRDFAVDVVHGQPATMSGVVTFPGARPGGVYVICQGRYTGLAADGSYVLTGLDSGRWDGGVVWDYGDYEYMTTVSLAPGSNVVNFTVPP